MSKGTYVYAVMTPEDGDVDMLYSTASKAIARLKGYGPVERGAVGKLHAGKAVFILPSAEDEYPETHAIKWRVF
jgi:hypothetical protein